MVKAMKGRTSRLIQEEFPELKNRSDEIMEVVSCDKLSLVGSEGSKATYEGAFKTTRSGVYEYGFRIFPKNELLENRMELPLVKWI